MANKSPDPKHQFKTGEPSANPKGRPKGSRNKLGEDFIKALVEHWQENGKAVLNDCATKSPAAYMRVVASLLPKELIIKDGNAFTDAINELSDDQIADAIEAFRHIVGVGGGTSEQAGKGKPHSVH